MFTTAVLAFREFLEAFLIVGVFLGVSRKLSLKKEKEILSASAAGITTSLLLPIGAFLLGERAKSILSEKNADTLEGYLLVFSGIFIAYVVFSLHKFMEPHRHAMLNKVKEELINKELFDISLFLTIVFFIAREGFEIAVLTGTTSLFSVFSQNLIGLFIGFGLAGIIGTAAFFSVLKIPMCRIFQFAEWTIVFFGAAMVKNGVGILTANYFNFHLEKIIPINLSFLPSDATIFGLFIKNLFGLEKQFSLLNLFIMAFYAGSIYLFFIPREKEKSS